ncbi:hypothetical protein BU17DRAFT_69933 [Hysterangium stoloniferum]|nr:hypothetical protein BU17DRAFT_69933 [Hysterangium stoloniferum]
MPLPICSHMLDARWNTIEAEMSEFLAETIKERSERIYELVKNVKEHSERSGGCAFSKDLKKYLEKSGGAAKSVEEDSDRKDGLAKHLKNYSKRNVEPAKVLKRQSERSIKLAQYLRKHSEEHTDFAKNLEEHSGRNELTKHLRRNHKFTKKFDGSSGWLQWLFPQEFSILDQQKISVEYFYEATAEGKSSLLGKRSSVVNTKESVEEESLNTGENRVVIRQAIEGTLPKMECPRSSLGEGDSEDS